MPPAELPLFPGLDPGLSKVLDARAREDALTAELIEYCSRRRLPAVLPDTIEAGDAWGANCGPKSLAAVLGLPTVAAARPLVHPFRGFMSPTDMLNALAAAARAGDVVSFRHSRDIGDPWPMLGLVRIQWLGPWCAPGVNPRAAYRHTHFVGVRTVDRRSKEAFALVSAAVDGMRSGALSGLPGCATSITTDPILIYDATPNRWLPLWAWERWNPTLWPKRATGWAPVTRIDVVLRTGPKGQVQS